MSTKALIVITVRWLQFEGFAIRQRSNYDKLYSSLILNKLNSNSIEFSALSAPTTICVRSVRKRGCTRNTQWLELQRHNNQLYLKHYFLRFKLVFPVYPQCAFQGFSLHYSAENFRTKRQKPFHFFCFYPSAPLHSSLRSVLLKLRSAIGRVQKFRSAPPWGRRVTERRCLHLTESFTFSLHPPSSSGNVKNIHKIANTRAATGFTQWIAKKGYFSVIPPHFR